MGLISRLLGGDAVPRERVEPRVSPRAASPENPSTPLTSPDAWLIDWASGGSPGAFGPVVTEQTSMAVSAVYRCTALIAGLIASLPLKIYRDDPDKGRIEITDHKYSTFFTTAAFPGRAMTSFTWRELWSLNTSLWGNHYSVIRYNQAARIVGFESALPWQVEVVRLLQGPLAGQNAYVVTWPTGEREPVLQEDIIHIPGLGFDGMKGYSRIRHFARNAVSLAKMLEEHTGRLHENSARPSVAVELPPKIGRDGLQRMKAFWNEEYTGRMNVGRPLFVDNGAKVTPMTISAEDLQTIAERNFQVEDICRFWGVPPVLVGGDQTTTWGSGVQQIVIGFLLFTLESELQRIEAELRLKLFMNSQEYPRFDRDALRALDPLTDAQTAAAEATFGGIVPNEYRRRKHRAAVPDGDTVLINSTMMPLSRAINPPQPAPAPSTTART